jgi:hypothetical protein
MNKRRTDNKKKKEKHQDHPTKKKKNISHTRGMLYSPIPLQTVHL